MQIDMNNEDILFHNVSVQKCIQYSIAIPYKTFNLMKKSSFIKNAMDSFVSVNEIRLENLIQLW